MRVRYLESYSDVGVPTAALEPEFSIYENVGNVEDHARQTSIPTNQMSK
jgi:hypothetical protein